MKHLPLGFGQDSAGQAEPEAEAEGSGALELSGMVDYSGE